jgi:hypothetical protein
MAVLPPRDYPDGEDMRFMETAAFNRHLDLRFFKGADEALAWLTEEKE